MMKLNQVHRRALFVIALALATAVSAMAAAPVTVTTAVTPAGPGGTATVKATITINDSSVLQSMVWKQTDGVPVTLSGTTSDTVSAVLPNVSTYKAQLFEILEEQPLASSKLPKWIPAPNPYAGGLQERFGVAAVSPHALTDAGAIKFDLAVTTSSGTYHNAITAAAATLPWAISPGQRDVPIKVPVLLHAPTQASYNWALTVPSGSATKLVDATTQNAEFTPDVTGTYTATITNLKTNAAIQIPIAAGKWKGIITGQDSSGNPTTDPSCNNCHVGKAAVFSIWAKSGHAGIFTQNVSAAGHYGTSCLECHSVGFADPALGNNGITDQSDWAGLKGSGLIEHGASINWTKILSDYPKAASMTNIQCDNCHGPFDGPGHGNTAMRHSLSSDVCGSCHGEPPRHGRYQEWQMSAHANYETAVAEGTNTTCGKCHSAQGFLQWQDNNFSDAALVVDWTADTVHPQTCATCHDPHNVGTTSSSASTDAKPRVNGSTPKLMAGFTATNVGTGAICMTCHNSRRGLRNDQVFGSSTDLSQAPHAGPQADIIMGQNLYFVSVGNPGYHGTLEDTCVTCHMEKTATPAGVIAMANVGTNHTFYADPGICGSCHSAAVTADKVQSAVGAKMTALKAEIEKAILGSIQAQIRLGNSVDVGGKKTLKSASEISSVEFIDSHGRAAINAKLADGTSIAAISLASVKVVRPGGSTIEILKVTDPNVAKAGWNYMMVESDKSEGVHNPAFVNGALDIALFATKAVNSGATTGVGGGSSTIGGGPGNGAGAVSCTSPYVYWAEIAGHAPGIAGSQWRTDLVARNLAATNASLKFILHQASGNLQGTGTVGANAQSAFEDIVGTIGGQNNTGSLEICSDQPLLVLGRIFNQADAGTFGQNLDGSVADNGFTAGQTASLIGLRQKSNLFRSNLSVTNSGTKDAQVSVTLFDSTGNALNTYTLAVPAGLVLQDTEPFKNRANAPDVGWGFATVTVLSGSNIHTSASMIDMKTNDPTTIPPKQ